VSATVVILPAAPLPGVRFRFDANQDGYTCHAKAPLFS
jgi:hypothetical protein